MIHNLNNIENLKPKLTKLVLNLEDQKELQDLILQH